MAYDPNRHHRRSIRRIGYDYSQAGAYFLTICVDNRACIFGKIEKGEMFRNHFGDIAYDCWYETLTKRENVELDSFIVMPNHIHSLLIITERHEGSRPSHTGKFESPTQTVGAIMRGYKSSVTSRIGQCFDERGHCLYPDLPEITLGVSVWQSNYHDNIVRDDASFDKISDYIKTNPQKWEDDRFFE